MPGGLTGEIRPGLKAFTKKEKASQSAENKMIDVTRMNDSVFTINAELIESIDEVPDTVITLTTGKKIIVKESRQKVKSLVKLYKKEIFGVRILENEE